MYHSFVPTKISQSQLSYNTLKNNKHEGHYKIKPFIYQEIYTKLF